MSKFKCGLILIMLISIWGCSKGNDNSVNLDASGKHPAGWAVATVGGKHPALFQANREACAECHGSAVDSSKSGGTSGVSCFSAARNGIACHPSGPSGHPAGWSAPGSHGAAAKADPGFTYCTGCHGSNFTGGSGKSCMTCHTSAPHPAAPWRGTTATGTTHITTSQTTSNLAECARCHLNNQRLLVPQVVPAGTTPGCFNNTLCHGVKSGHPVGWSAANSHGASAKAAPTASQGFAYCTNCHGANFVSGIGTSCLTCHTTAPHPVAAHWRSTATIAQPTTHTTTDVNNATVCSACHNSTQKNLSQPYLARFASSPAGSFNAAAPVTCFNAGLCHGDVRKIINCDACHSIATSNPFRSMAGATAATDSKVGAHVKHLNASVQSPAYSANISCSECHAVPVSPDISGAHRNGSNDVPLSGTLARTGSLSPSYSAATGVCANTYCHGTTLTGGGSNKAPVWNQANYLAAGCGTCHGYPPTTVRNGAAAHSTSSACSGCHSHINAANNGFSDAAKHINGIVEASGGGHGGAPYPGASHKSQTTSGCFGCHPANAAGSTYPATSGTPPNCRGCHLNANPGTDPQCSDCHGSVANNGSATLAGRPVAGGTAFPNRPGEHNRSQHVGRACTVCHPFTTGDARHGWSNRVKSTAAQVGGAGTSITSWNATTKSCTPTCHSSETW